MIAGNCLKNTPRTGFGNCDITEDYTSALLFTRADELFKMDQEDFISKLTDNVVVKKMFPIKNIVGDPLSGGDVATSDIGARGGTVSIGENQTVISYQIDAGSCFMKELYKFEKQKWRIFRVDASGNIWGTIVTKGDVDYMAGFLVSDIFPREVPANDNNSYQIFLDVRYGINYRDEKKNKFGFYVGLNAVPDGLVGVKLKAVANKNAMVVTACGGYNVTSEMWADESIYEPAPDSVTLVYTDEEGTAALKFTPSGEYVVPVATKLASLDVHGYDGVNEPVKVGV